MNRGGFAGRILTVDLTTRQVTKRRLEMDDATDYIGGLGLCLKIASEQLQPEVDAFDAGNVIVLGAGPLVGTGVPSSSRVFAVTKLPSSGTIGWCGAGGVSFGCHLKNAGFDHIVIRGRADRPVSIQIDDDSVRIVDAESLWGQSVEATCRALWNRSQSPGGILAIGPAGENRVVFAMAFVDRIATLGRGGLGAVMGAKNLKAVWVHGSRGVRVAERKAYRRINETLMKEIREYPYLKEWQQQGMTKAFPMVPADVYQKIRRRRVACVSCPIGCKDVIELRDGPDAGTVVCTSSVINLFTPIAYGMTDYRHAVRLMQTLDRFGLDAFEFFGLMTCVAELVRTGVISAAEAGEAVDVGALSSMTHWVEKISTRSGLGAVLAGGFNGLIRQYGPPAAAAAPALIRGMHPYAGPGAALPWNLFGTMELGQLLDPRGPHVGSGGSPTYFARRPLTVFYKHFRRMGIPDSAVSRIIDPEAPPEQQLKVGRLLKHAHCWFAILGSMGICVRGQVNRFYSAERCADLYQAVTGIPTDSAGLHQRAARVWTLYRRMNTTATPTGPTDPLPPRWLEKDGFREYCSEQPLTAGQIEAMITDYEDEWER
jgi:aldehyde:ferredoxin oxidoreductase